MKKRSNFLLLLFLCVLEQDTSFFAAAAKLAPYSHHVGVEEEPRQGRRTVLSDEDTRSGRNPKRPLSPADTVGNTTTGLSKATTVIMNRRELPDIERINKQMDLSSLESRLAFKSVNNTLQGPCWSAFDPTTAVGYNTPPTRKDIPLPLSNESTTSNSSNDSSNSSSAGPIFSFPGGFSHDTTTSNFNLRPGRLATLTTFGGSASSFEPEFRLNAKFWSQSKSLINDSTGDYELPPSFRYPHIFKNDGDFLERLDQCGLGCRSSDLDSENSDDDFGAELDDEYRNEYEGSAKESATGTEYCSAHLSAQTAHRSSSATSELGRHLAATSLEFVHCPSTDEAETTGLAVEKQKPPFEVEYAPWIAEDVEDAFIHNSFEHLKSDFELRPLNEHVEIVEAPEIEEGRNFFRSVFKPFQDYGEFAYDEETLKAAVEIVRPLSEQVTDSVAEMREQNLKRSGKDVVSVRHEEALKYAKAAVKLNLIEGQWIYTIVNGGTVDFLSYYQTIAGTSEMRKWSVKRGRKLISAMIPSIMFSSNFEEVLIDFLDDFFLSHVLETENENLQTEEEQSAMVREIIKIGKEMIRHCLSHTIIESYLLYVKPLLIESDSELLYETLIDTMNSFTIPKPYVAPKRRKPEESDEAYLLIEDPAERQRAFEADLSDYQEKVKKDDRKARYQEDLIRVKQIHKNRSFETLKVLVSLFPESVMRPDSRWMNGNYLRMPKYQMEVFEEEKGGDSELDDKNESSRKKKKKLIEQKLFGVGAHENQDFFDALFFARILRACLVQEDTIKLAANSLEPFLKSFQITIFDSPLSFRYLKAVDKFIRITRFNVVANCPPPIINYKRYLIAYLIRNGANWMGIVPSKVQSRAINFEFLSLFEALHLYQVVDPSSPVEREQRMKALIATKDIDYKIPIIYYTYNPIPYSTIANIIEEVSKEVPSISFSKLNGYYEIFAMAKNVDLLPIIERKVLKFLNSGKAKSAEDPIKGLQSNNEDLEFRRPLPEQYDAIFVWNMSRRLKNLSELGNHLNYPYGTFASRIVLARRFGVSFDAANFIPQLSENFTWLECIDFINFFLEREAQLLIENAQVEIDADFYQVYRVVDTQKHLHKSRQLDSDEPTHHINLLIESALNGLPKPDADAIKAQYSQSQLFSRYKRGLGKIDPPVLLRLSREQAVKILKWFIDDENIPETFSLRVIYE